ncbi:hypothetical protein D3C76_913200 [compost metagenome]
MLLFAATIRSSDVQQSQPATATYMKTKKGLLLLYQQQKQSLWGGVGLETMGPTPMLFKAWYLGEICIFF